MELLIRSSNTSFRVASLFLTAVVGLAGCGAKDAAPNATTAPIIPNATKAPVISSQPDPTPELRKIAELGKAKALSPGNEGPTFVDVSVESISSSSLTYPYVGRITVDYKKSSDGRIFNSSYAIYFKHDGKTWLFSKYCYGIKGKGFPWPLTQERALAPAAGVFESDSPGPQIKDWWP